MQKPAKLIFAASAIAVLLSATLVPVSASAASVEEGKKIAQDRKKGNCTACHAYEGANMPGNAAPPLVAMKARYPDKAKLRAHIFDPTKANPNTIMPPYGKHGILSDKEIDAITEWVHTL